jgi:hypothetical protein
LIPPFASEFNSLGTTHKQQQQQKRELHFFSGFGLVQWWLMTFICGGKPLPDDGPRHFELENTLEDSDDCAKQPAQLAVLTPAAGSRRPTWRGPLGSRSRDSLLWTAHELAAQRHGRLRWSTSPPGEYRPSLHLTRLSRGAKAKIDVAGRLSMSVPPGTMVPRDCPKRAAPQHLRSRTDLT